MPLPDTLPVAAAKRLALHVTPAAERAIRQGHPWLFDRAITRQSHQGAPGDLAVIFDSKREFLAIGLYDPTSPLRVRVLQHRRPATINRAWFTDQLQAAATIRQPLAAEGTTGYRLVHGENDHLPGLIIDRYADVLVLKLYTESWLPHLRDVVAGLGAVQPFSHLVLRLSRNMAAASARYGLTDGMLLTGETLDMPVTFTENGLSFAADVLAGHKTGFFFDQRDNRQKVRQLAVGRNVLDVFAYTGGFSVYAAAGGAQHVTSLDTSAPALQAAQNNFALNMALPRVAATQHETLVADAFTALDQMIADGRTFSMVIVDPPAFAKNEAEIPTASAAYTRLAQQALQLVETDGILVMASCSSRITAPEFRTLIIEAAQARQDKLLEIAFTGHALDHPISFTEGAYLKCLFAVVTR